MAKFSLCIEPVLTDLDFYDKIRAAAEMGFDAIEFWDPAGKDVSKIGRLAVENNIKVAICCVQSVWAIRMNNPVDQVMKNMTEPIKLVKEMGCDSLIGLTGDLEGGVDFQKNILIENLKRVADVIEKENVTLNIEALNSLVDHKGYYLDSSCVGFEIIKSVGCDNIKLLYDIYHMQIMEGNIIANITKNIDLIGHIHSAGVPGRIEPFMGENNYKAILKAIENSGYSRYFGLEYFPSYDSKQSLMDVKKYFGISS